MIAQNLHYYRPESLAELIGLYRELTGRGLRTQYFAGGTELLSQSGSAPRNVDAWIDLKKVPECQVQREENGQFIFGSALPLNDVVETNLFPLLSRACRPVADHTIRNRLTLGGNVCGHLPYREALLPLLVAEATMVLEGPEGRRELSVDELFNKRMQLLPGELLLQMNVKASLRTATGYDQRRVRYGSVDYPLVHVSALRVDGTLRLACCGLCAMPFRSRELEACFQPGNGSFDNAFDAACRALPGPAKSDMRGSAEYRLLLFKQSLSVIWNNNGSVQ